MPTLPYQSPTPRRPLNIWSLVSLPATLPPLLLLRFPPHHPAFLATHTLHLYFFFSGLAILAALLALLHYRPSRHHPATLLLSLPALLLGTAETLLLLAMLTFPAQS